MFSIATKLSDRSSLRSLFSHNNFLSLSSSSSLHKSRNLSVTMATITSAAPTTNDKPFTISQIKAYIPIVLDMNKFNYDVWRELFETHCTSFSVLEHIVGTGNPSLDIAKGWNERDGLVKMWIDDTIFESILDTILQTKCLACDLWVPIENLF